MVNNSDSLLAIVFPYTPVRSETALEIVLPEGKSAHDVNEIWSNANWHDRVTSANDGTIRIPLDIPGDCDLLAIHVRMEG